MTTTPAGTTPRRRRRAERLPSRQSLSVAGLLLSLLLIVLAATVPGSSAALQAKITNATNTTNTAPYFTCAAAYTASGPGIYYRLNETSGTTAADTSGNNRNGVYRGTITYGAATPCKRDTGTAITLNGTTSYLGYATTITITITYTIETWFKTTTTRGGRLIGFGAAATGASTTTDRQIYMTNTGRLVYGINPVLKQTITSTDTYNDGNWHHTMATQSASGMRLYVDGALVASDPATVTSTNYSGYFRLGYDNLATWPNTPTSNYLAGTLDEAAAYGKTLTATDALNHYKAGT